MGATSKQRTPSRCREWERERRNRFNEAVAKLGELIKSTITESNGANENAAETMQFPKIEIIQRAIILIKEYLQEKSQMKAEILALKVKFDKIGNEKKDNKDASTQISNSQKKKLGSRYNKLLMIRKCKHNALKKKAPPLKEVPKPIVDCPEQEAKVKKLPALSNLPQILPKIAPHKNKVLENTIVVMPAAPYLVPQRSLLFPAAQPTFVLLNPNMSLNKPNVPNYNRITNDTTKTTMVNILPISAYSRPLSASKSKKTHIKPKQEVAKKKVKECKRKPETEVEKSDIPKTDKGLKQTNEIKKPTNEDTKKSNDIKSDNIGDKLLELSKTDETLSTTSKVLRSSTKDTNDVSKLSSIAGQTNQLKEDILTKSDMISNNKNNISNKDIETAVTLEKPKSDFIPSTEITNEKESNAAEKQNKLNILDTSLCENTVDGGNARLELAEEFLAASPTAAFLMSFPLVSGNRADSPAEENTNLPATPIKDNNATRLLTIPQTEEYYEKPISNDIKEKVNTRPTAPTKPHNKELNQLKYTESSKHPQTLLKPLDKVAVNMSTENSFLNLSVPSIISTPCTVPDPTFAFDFDCNVSKCLSQASTLVTSNNLFYKSDPMLSVRNSIYSTSNLSSGHDFNSLGLYPCAMEKYSSKSKSDYSNVEDNLIKIGSSRLTYDVDLGWSHKGLDFVNSTTNPPTFSKDNIITTVSTSYNPFNPEFHVPLPVVSNTTKKENYTKPSSSFSDSITSFYSQPTTSLWSEDMPFYTGSTMNSAKQFNTKYQNYLSTEHTQTSLPKQINLKQCDTKQMTENYTENLIKPTNLGVSQQMPEKFTKKSPNKMHINWMTSETRPLPAVCNTTQNTAKEPPKAYLQHDSLTKRQENMSHNDGNYFPLPFHNFTSQVSQDDFQVWPATRPFGTTEISIDPPINLPTLVGDLALGPHDKKRNMESRVPTHTDIQQCNNFLSVTQIMNRSENMSSRFQGSNIDHGVKPQQTKHNITQYSGETHRKNTARVDNSLSQPYYSFNDTKADNCYETMKHFSNIKLKANVKTEKSPKTQKNSYSAEALIRGGTFTQKVPDPKFLMPTQKYNEFNSQQDSVAQVSHYPPILDYSDNSYTGQQFSGTTLYNSTTNTISNSFYSNFMPGTSNLMTSNYSGAPFSSDFIDYSQSAECNYTNHKYEEFKMKGNPIFQHEKVQTHHKSTRREHNAKHKLECSKKEGSKKYQSKRPKLNAETEDWNDSTPWQNKTQIKRHPNLMPEEIPFTNYNQMPVQYQPDIFNSHLMPPNVQNMGTAVDRSLASFPATSRANFNLSTIFPEITMKVQ